MHHTKIAALIGVCSIVASPAFAGPGGRSSMAKGSATDVATEVTEMIVAQRDYTANSKVFQKTTEAVDVMMNYRRSPGNSSKTTSAKSKANSARSALTYKND